MRGDGISMIEKKYMTENEGEGEDRQVVKARTERNVLEKNYGSSNV